MSEEKPAFPLRRLLLLVPFLGFTGLAILFFSRIEKGGNPSILPSALIGKDVPAFSLPPLPESPLAGIATDDLKRGRVTLVNVWASWCIPCRDEHPFLMELSQRPDIDLYGINNKDNGETAKRFLGRFGNPFKRVGADVSGRVSIDWGVYGVPETFVVDGKGTIRLRHVGPLTPEIIKTLIDPAIAAAAKG